MDGKISEINQNLNLPSLYRSTTERYLHYIFKYLSRNSQAISLYTYQYSSPLPLLLSRKMFHTLNGNEDDIINEEHFVKGYMNIFYGSIDERMKFLYDFLSYNNKLNYQDIKIIYYNILSSLKIDKFSTIDELVDLIKKDESEGLNISYEFFSDFLMYKDCGLFYIFYSFLFYCRAFTLELLSFMMTKQGKGINEGKSSKNLAEKSFISVLTSQSLSTKCTLSSKIFGNSLDFSKKNISLFVSFLKLSANSYDIIKIMHKKISPFCSFYLNDSMNEGKNAEDEIIKIESDSEDKTRSAESINDEDDNISIDNELLELSTFESDFISTKTALTLSSSSKVNPVSIKTPFTPSPKNNFFHPVFPMEEGLSLCLSQKSFQGEEESVVFQHEKLTERNCFVKLFEKIICVYNKHEILSVMPLRRIFPCSKREIEKCNFEGKNLFRVTMTPVIFEGLMKDEVYNFLFPQKINAKKFIESINKISEYKDYKDYYRICGLIGEGHFGKVYKACSIAPTNPEKMYAIKLINRDVLTQSKNDLLVMNNEIDIAVNILSTSHHNNIINCYEVFESLHHISIVFDYVENGALTSHLNLNYSLDKIDSTLSQLISGVRHLHDFGVVHRDIKPENILIDKSKTIKVIDFGLATVISHSELIDENYGSLLFTAPEILLNENYNTKVDMWSLGVLAYYFLFGVLPFSINERDLNHDIAVKIVSKEIAFPYKRIDKNKIDLRIRKFIVQALTKNKHDRPFLNDIEYEKL